MTQALAFEGTVARFEWTNPHVYLVIEDADEVEWLIETDAPAVLTRSGWTPESLAPGDEVAVRTRPHKDRDKNHYVDGRDHPPNGERTNQGHSIGWWEGDTLVVDTILFADNRSPYAVGIPSGAQKHVVERYTLSEDGTQMLIDVFLEDPEYLAEPLTETLVWNYSPHLERLSIPCDPEVARRFLE